MSMGTSRVHVKNKAIVFSVSPLDDFWQVLANGKKLRLKASLDAAVGAAIKAGIQAHARGSDTKVLFSDGKACITLWSNGRLLLEDLPDKKVSDTRALSISQRSASEQAAMRAHLPRNEKPSIQLRHFDLYRSQEHEAMRLGFHADP